MYYRYEARIADATKCSSRRELKFRNWTGIFQCFDPDMCRKWYCIAVPKWYEHNLAVPSKAWFTQYGFEKWHSKMLETIRDLLERHPYFEIRILTCTKPKNLVMHGKTQCISANYNFKPNKTKTNVLQYITIENIDTKGI